MEVKHSSHSQDNNYKLGENGLAYSRLIISIPGFFHSNGDKNNSERKAKSKFNLPEYIRFLTENYDKFRSFDKEIARIILTDHLNILLRTKLTRKRGVNLHYTLKLNKNESEQNARSLVKQVYEIFRKVYPLMELTEDSIRVYSRNKEGIEGYSPYLVLNAKSITSSRSNYSLVIQ